MNSEHGAPGQEEGSTSSWLSRGLSAVWQAANGTSNLETSGNFLDSLGKARGWIEAGTKSPMMQGLESQARWLGPLAMLTGGVQAGQAVADLMSEKPENSTLDNIVSGIGGLSSFVGGAAAVGGATLGAPLTLALATATLASSGNSTVKDWGLFEDKEGNKLSGYEGIYDLIGNDLDAMLGIEEGGFLDYGTDALGVVGSAVGGTVLNAGVGIGKAAYDLGAGACELGSAAVSGIGTGLGMLGSGIGSMTGWW